jgi:hypothetical protein
LGSAASDSNAANCALRSESFDPMRSRVATTFAEALPASASIASRLTDSFE